MKEIDINEGYSSPLSEEDLDFAKTIKSKHNIPLDILLVLIISFRNSRSNVFVMSDFAKNKKTQKTSTRKAIVLNAKVTGITITTETGSLKLDHTDNYFKYFIPTIQLMKHHYKKFLPNSIEKDREWLLDGDIFNMYNILNENTSLRPTERNFVIGLFLIHFKIYKRKVLKSSQDDLDENPTSDQDFNHYLAKIVKSRLVTILKRFTV